MPDGAPGGTRGSDPDRPLTSAERARMPLVDLIMREALDEEYAEVSRRGPQAERSRRPGVLAAVVVLLFGVLVTISFQQTRSNEDVVAAGRSALSDRVVARRQVVSRAQDRIVALRDENTTAERAQEQLDETAATTSFRLVRLQRETGFSAATGEGVRVVVGDSPDGLARHRVYDEDLALLTNGLWAAGASAIAVNGQRLTVLSAFRFSGGTIRVNDTNLIPPYTVDALGDTRSLQADLLDTTTGLAFTNRAAEFGFTVDMQNEQQLRVPPAPDGLRRLRSATPASQDEDPRSGRSTR